MSYALFCGSKYEARGGVLDFDGIYQTPEEAMKSMPTYFVQPWGHIALLCDGNVSIKYILEVSENGVFSWKEVS